MPTEPDGFAPSLDLLVIVALHGPEQGQGAVLFSDDVIVPPVGFKKTWQQVLLLLGSFGGSSRLIHTHPSEIPDLFKSTAS